MTHVESWEPCGFTEAPDGPQFMLLTSSGSKKKEPRYACLSEAKASHSQRMWAEISSFTPHYLHKGLSSSPSRWRCLLRVLCPVRRPVTALDCVLLKDRNLALAPRLGPQINSQACLWVSPRPVVKLLRAILINAEIHYNVTPCRVEYSYQLFWGTILLKIISSYFQVQIAKHPRRLKIFYCILRQNIVHVTHLHYNLHDLHNLHLFSFFLEFLTLEDSSDRLSWNNG